MPDNCTRCLLCTTRKNIVHGEGPDHPLIFLLGEGPGHDENESGRPFVGKAGKELDNYLWKFTGIQREDCYITNLVLCQPPNNRDPKQSEIEACMERFQEEWGSHHTSIIGALGRLSLQWLLSDPSADIEMLHGIPQFRKEWGTIVPLYHPAAGLHNTRLMISLQRDFTMLGRVLRGEVSPKEWEDQYPSPDYREVPILTDPTIPRDINYVCLDTETTVEGKPWSMQVSYTPGEAQMIRVSPPAFNQVRWRKGYDYILHNALFDIPVLQNIGLSIDSNRVTDTMIMAYLLQDEPQGLKALAYRHCGMKMESYDDVIAEAQKVRSLEYLINVARESWPNCEPILQWIKIGPRTKQPKNIGKKAQKIIPDVEERGSNPWDRWHSIQREEGRGMVESKLGIMPRVDLSHVEREKAIYYSCRDADALCRVYPKLLQRILEFNLYETLLLDTSILQMVLDMMKFGMPVNKEKLQELASEFGKKMNDIEGEINRVTGYMTNLGSPVQVAELLYSKLGLTPKKMTQTKKQESTDHSSLEAIKEQHPIVSKILEWREYEKLLSTYATAIPQLIDSNGRIHPEIKVTRTATGRLATAKPNVMAQPVRSEEGRKIRGCYVANTGCLLLSLDFSQIELRVTAHISQDPLMLRVYHNGGDIHSTTASKIFGIPISQLDPYKHRRPAKTTNFSVVYGTSPRGLQEQLIKDGADPYVWDIPTCKNFIKQWFHVYPCVKESIDHSEQEARWTGYVRDMFGRIRLIPELQSAHQSIQNEGVRKAFNMKIQSGAQGIMKTAMSKLTPQYQYFLREGYICRPLMQIHDDLLFEIEEGILETCVPLFKAIMETCVELSVPIQVDAKIGGDWGDMRSWKEE